MSHEKPPRQPTREEWNEMKAKLKRKKDGQSQETFSNEPPYDVEAIKRHLSLVEEERNKSNLSNLPPDKYAEMEYLQFEIDKKKEMWHELGEFVDKVKTIGKTEEDMVKINSLKKLPKEILAGIFLSSSPDEWGESPLFYTEIYRVIDERLNPKGKENE